MSCESDARGRTGFENREYPQANYFSGALACCNAIDTQAILASGLTGKAFGDEVNRLRLEKITEFKRKHTP